MNQIQTQHRDSYLVQDILEILLDTNTETATIPESIKTLITVMDIHKILQNSNMKTATTPESEEISKISLIALLVYRLNTYCMHSIISRYNQSFVSEREGRCYELALLQLL